MPETKLHRPHYGLQSERLDWQPKVTTARMGFKPDIAKLRELARASREGGRCTCASCGYTLTVTFCKLVSRPLHEDSWVCKYCIETKGLK